jgi:hypothetical protein
MKNAKKMLTTSENINFNVEDLTLTQVNSIVDDFTAYYKAKSENDFNQSVKVERDETSVTLSGLVSLPKSFCEEYNIDFDNSYKNCLFNELDTDKFAEIFTQYTI